MSAAQVASSRSSSSSLLSRHYFKKRNVIAAIFLLLLVLSGAVFMAFISDTKITIKHYISSNLKYSPPWTSAAAGLVAGHYSAASGDVIPAAAAADCAGHLSYSDWDTLFNSDTLTGAQIMKYFKWSNRQSCQLVHDFGGTMYKKPSGWDGQKSVCIDPQVAPQPGDCLVYSFGINDEWSFDEQMSAYGCQVYAFDPSMLMMAISHQHQDHYDHNPGNIHFYKWGLGVRDQHDADRNWEIRSLSSIYEELSLTRHGRHKVIDYLKIDIEATEWQVIPEMMSSGMLSNVRQLGIEIHLVTDAPLEKYRGYAKLLRSMETMGMVRFDSEYNPWFIGNFTRLELWNQSQGYEIAWYNANLTRNRIN